MEQEKHNLWLIAVGLNIRNVTGFVKVPTIQLLFTAFRTRIHLHIPERQSVSQTKGFFRDQHHVGNATTETMAGQKIQEANNIRNAHPSNYIRYLLTRVVRERGQSRGSGLAGSCTS